MSLRVYSPESLSLLDYDSYKKMYNNPTLNQEWTEIPVIDTSSNNKLNFIPTYYT